MKFITINALFLFIILFAHKVSAESFAPLTPSTIFIAGDSTAANYTNSAQQGWGPMFQHYFNSDNISIEKKSDLFRLVFLFAKFGLALQIVGSEASLLFKHV